jgi:hypothetical protein
MSAALFRAEASAFRRLVPVLCAQGLLYIGQAHKQPCKAYCPFNACIRVKKMQKQKGGAKPHKDTDKKDAHKKAPLGLKKFCNEKPKQGICPWNKQPAKKADSPKI